MEKFPGFGYAVIKNAMVRKSPNILCTKTKLSALNYFAEIISMCKTTVNYNAGDRDMVSFRGNTPCRVMSKSIGEDLWEIDVS